MKDQSEGAHSTAAGRHCSTQAELSFLLYDSWLIKLCYCRRLHFIVSASCGGGSTQASKDQTRSWAPHQQACHLVQTSERYQICAISHTSNRVITVAGQR